MQEDRASASRVEQNGDSRVASFELEDTYKVKTFGRMNLICNLIR